MLEGMLYKQGMSVIRSLLANLARTPRLFCVKNKAQLSVDAHPTILMSHYA
jgi:hypothetical protein